MKAISLWQPWALLLAAGLKRVETRSWKAFHRGPLLIHAAKKWNGDLQRLCEQEPFRSAILATGAKVPTDLRLGAIVGRVDLVECYPVAKVATGPLTPAGAVTLDRISRRLIVSETELAFGDYSEGRWAWHCENAIAFATPAPFRGAQGFFDVPDDIAGRA